MYCCSTHRERISSCYSRSKSRKGFFRKIKQCLRNKPICVGISTMTGSQISYALKIADFIRDNSQISNPGTKFYNIVQQYGFLSPSSLEEEANIRWESEDAFSISQKMRKIDLNLNLLTYFIGRKWLDKVEGNILLTIVMKILMAIAKFRWKHRKFQFCPEFIFLNRLTN